MNYLKSILRLICLLVPASAFSTEIAVDYEEFLSKQDMVWDRLPADWGEAPFTGNGTLGAYMVHDAAEGALRFELGNSLVHDHRKDDKSIYGRGRLLIGSLVMRPKGKIVSGECRLDFLNAELRGVVRTTAGEIEFRHSTLSGEPYIIVETQCSGDESVIWEFIPAKADSPRQLLALHKKGHPHYKSGYKSNPAPELILNGQVNLCRQPLLDGGETATAWKEISAAGRKVLVATIEHSFPERTASASAVANIDALSPDTLDNLRDNHRRRWSDYYSKSFISLPDKRVENFYWAQMYKLGSATQPDGCIMDNCGPWLTETPWPNAWWNLNVQLSYWPLLVSNHLELNVPLINAVHSNLQNLINNVPVQYRHDSAAIPVSTDFSLSGKVKAPGEGKAQIGCLPWLCHNLWLHYRYSMDTEFLRETLYPVLKRAVGYYLHFLHRGDDGLLHLAPTFSPEYGVAPDCNFDLALLRWGSETLLEISRILDVDDSQRMQWQQVCDSLTPFPEDAVQGMMIGRDVPYSRSHRHYSHLLMFYPLYQLNAEMPGAYERMDRAVRHWHSISGNIFAYSYTGAASMYASFGKGDEALRHLNSALALKSLCPNTLYRESGPVIETPLSAAKCVHDMVLQSWGGKLRVFPAVPSEWNDVSFAGFRAEGAFIVSAVRRKGKTISISVQSLAGEPCIIKTDMTDPMVVEGAAALVPGDNDGEYRISLTKGERVTITASGIPVATVGEVDGAGQNLYGSAKRQIPH